MLATTIFGTKTEFRTLSFLFSFFANSIFLTSLFDHPFDGLSAGVYVEHDGVPHHDVDPKVLLVHHVHFVVQYA